MASWNEKAASWRSLKFWTSITKHVFGHAARHKSVKGMEKLRRLLSSKMGGEKTKSFAVLSRFVCLFCSDDIHHLSNLLRDVICIELRRVESSSKDMFANFAMWSLMQMSSQDFHTPLHDHGSQQQIFFGSSLKFTTTSSGEVPYISKRDVSNKYPIHVPWQQVS